MRERIIRFITDYAEAQDRKGPIKEIWKQPLVCFGDAGHPGMDELKRLVHPQHVLPEDILPGAKTIVSYFFPFAETIGDSNQEGKLASKEWAMAYEKTNASFLELNQLLIEFLKQEGISAATTAEAVRYDESLLKSRWSQRHIARLCGLGTFGKNNMLITEAGCCGRISTVVTSLETDHDPVVSEEYCLWLRSASCGTCITRCPSKALTKENFNRETCNNVCDENGEIHVGYGNSYVLSGTENALTRTGVCGKCVVGLPCTYRRP